MSMIVPLPGAPGVAECVKILESALNVARTGRIIQVAVATVEISDTPNTLETKGYWSAPQRQHHHIMNSLALVHGGLMDYSQNAELPERTPGVSLDHVVWNVALGPTSFDYIAWLVTQEMARIRAGAPAPLKVNFWKGRGGNVPEHKFLTNVFRPALDFIGAVEEETDIGGQSSDMFTLKDVSEAVRAGEKTPVFRAPEYARQAVAEYLGGIDPPVVITLRERDKWTDRNSDCDAWRMFADHLIRQGHNVVFVRDTEKAYEPFTSYSGYTFPTYPEASKNLHIRMALYEAAKANLFVSNGPASIAWFSDKPWLMFVPVSKNGDAYWANTPAFWEELQGVKQFEQYPWARQDQKIVWGLDTFENICAAWDDLMPRLSAAA